LKETGYLNLHIVVNSAKGKIYKIYKIILFDMVVSCIKLNYTYNYDILKKRFLNLKERFLKIKINF